MPNAVCSVIQQFQIARSLQSLTCKRDITSSNLRICSSGGVATGAGGGAGVGTRSDTTGTGVGGGGVGVGVGCVCDSGALVDDVDPGFAGRDGWRGPPVAGAEVGVLACSAVISCALGVEVPVAALARAAAIRSA